MLGRDEVLRSAGMNKWPADQRVKCLDTLALSWAVIAEYDKSTAGKVRGETLIVFAGFSGAPVSDRTQEGGKAPHHLPGHKRWPSRNNVDGSRR